MLSSTAYAAALELLRTHDDCVFQEQDLSSDSLGAFRLASLEKKVPHDLAPVVAARFAEIAILIGGHMSMHHHADACILSVMVSMDLPASEEVAA